jgi:phytanoyl-CoA hydroxylase
MEKTMSTKDKKNRRPLTPEQLEFYRENGYLVVEGIFSDETAREFNAHVRLHANNDFAALINPDRAEDLEQQDERPKSDIVTEEIHKTAEMATEIMKTPQVVEILETLQEDSVVGLSSQFIFKEAHSTYSNQAWRPHQDGFYPGDKEGKYITSNWFLRGADVENGTIYVYPGTQNLGLLEAEPQKSFREDPDSNPGSECQVPPEFLEKKVDVILPNNSVLFLNGYLVHGSYPNDSNRSRPWYSCCYITEGADYIVGASSKRKEIKLK